MTDDQQRPEGTDQAQGGSAPEEGTPRVTDKRRIDPETHLLREPTPDEAAADAAAADAVSQAEQAVEGAEEVVLMEGLVEAQTLAAERLEELQRAQAAHYNLEQQYAAYVKRSKVEAGAAHERGVASVAEALIPVLDDIELARRHGDLSGPFASIADKLEATLHRFGVERYGTEGEPFDPAVHEALMHGHSADVTEPTVQQVLQPGYRTAERVLRAARVAVVDPEG
ncbi:nucleotide exchange factor GrpE [Cellulomonas shaoxiangyii]|uniref:Protein GrpE n=1 Tax=Cellulomonas shaoxiangyii TaxID=2566013 RepID=A0A4P7SKK9_9CELL|nr:nucleotide exchange factor GrpE [Cellulomonas shaoxiangyii]QCB94730.1 nucleotide exchange factor GrpE [Cellulomonas shaoxiangyii]TGY86460.1 nucleotide exchange factor GrpE [Cellulomonas shaoxiangyii]